MPSYTNSGDEDWFGADPEPSGWGAPEESYDEQGKSDVGSSTPDAAPPGEVGGSGPSKGEDTLDTTSEPDPDPVSENGDTGGSNGGWDDDDDEGEDDPPPVPPSYTGVGRPDFSTPVGDVPQVAAYVRDPEGRISSPVQVVYPDYLQSGQVQNPFIPGAVYAGEEFYDPKSGKINVRATAAEVGALARSSALVAGTLIEGSGKDFGKTVEVKGPYRERTVLPNPEADKKAERLSKAAQVSKQRMNTWLTSGGPADPQSSGIHLQVTKQATAAAASDWERIAEAEGLRPTPDVDEILLEREHARTSHGPYDRMAGNFPYDHPYHRSGWTSPSAGSVGGKGIDTGLEEQESVIPKTTTPSGGLLLGSSVRGLPSGWSKDTDVRTGSIILTHDPDAGSKNVSVFAAQDAKASEEAGRLNTSPNISQFIQDSWNTQNARFSDYGRGVTQLTGNRLTQAGLSKDEIENARVQASLDRRKAGHTEGYTYAGSLNLSYGLTHIYDDPRKVHGTGFGLPLGSPGISYEPIQVGQFNVPGSGDKWQSTSSDFTPTTKEDAQKILDLITDYRESLVGKPTAEAPIYMQQLVSSLSAAGVKDRTEKEQLELDLLTLFGAELLEGIMTPTAGPVLVGPVVPRSTRADEGVALKFGASSPLTTVVVDGVPTASPWFAQEPKATVASGSGVRGGVPVTTAQPYEVPIYDKEGRRLNPSQIIQPSSPALTTGGPLRSPPIGPPVPTAVPQPMPYEVPVTLGPDPNAQLVEVVDGIPVPVASPWFALDPSNWESVRRQQALDVIRGAAKTVKQRVVSASEIARFK